MEQAGCPRRPVLVHRAHPWAVVGWRTLASRREILKTRVESAPAGTSSTELARVFTDEADHSFVQQRVGLLYGVLGIAVSGLYLVGVCIVLIGLPGMFWKVHLSPPKLIHLFVGPVLLAVAWLCRRPRLISRTLLSVCDLVGLTKLTATACTLIALTPPIHIQSAFLLLPVIVLIAAMRAALVPSPPRWTVLVVACAVTPAPIAAYLSTFRDPVAWVEQGVPRAFAVGITVGWCLVAIGCAFAIAKVIYGLRAEVKKATRLGQYTLEEKIGEGGMGVVYRARHALLRRPTAVKLLAPDRAGAHEIRRFEREVQLTSVLTHPNTVAIYDFGHTHDGIFYYAMEHLDGLSLHDLVEDDGIQPAGRVIYILSQIAGALAEAHAIGLVHRDVKPANVFLCQRGGLPDFVKVLDFGLVKHAGTSDPALSHVGAIAGTPHYMAPESITAPDSVDARVDIYALGAVGYFLLTGSTPFEGGSLVEICSHHLHSVPEPPSERLGKPVPPMLEKVILQCLEKSREARPASAAVLVDLLRTCQEESPWDLKAARGFWDTRASAKPAAQPAS
jgi:eukaryotic-like serine/threonine-protein kinase